MYPTQRRKETPSPRLGGTTREDSLNLPSWPPPPGQSFALQLERMRLPQRQAQPAHESHGRAPQVARGRTGPMVLNGT